MHSHLAAKNKLGGHPNHTMQSDGGTKRSVTVPVKELPSSTQKKVLSTFCRPGPVAEFAKKMLDTISNTEEAIADNEASRVLPPTQEVANPVDGIVEPEVVCPCCKKNTKQTNQKRETKGSSSLVLM